jgi:leucyl-tRNA synthetase
MFGWRWELGGPWDSKGIEGVYRFLHRVWDLLLAPVPGSGEEGDPSAEAIKALRRKVHQTIKKATDDLTEFSFNTYIAALMELSNLMAKVKKDLYQTPAWTEAAESFVLLLAPACPHLAEELWARLGREYSVHNQAWPVWDKELAAEETVEIVIQVNGKIKDRVMIPADAGEDEVREIALEREVIKELLGGKPPRKVIYVKGRLMNILP